jgi:hypothetical protein
MATENNITPEIAKKVASARYLGKNGTNIVGVGVGTKIIAGVDTLTPCVKFYVSMKTPPGDVAMGSIEPEKVLGIPTDVISVGRAFGPRINARRLRPEEGRAVGPGDSIGPKVEGASNLNLTFSGTLGAVLQNGENEEERFILSNNHILAVNGRVPPQSAIVAPGPEDGLGVEQKKIACLEKAVLLVRGLDKENYVDCAIAKVDKSANVTHLFPGGLAVGSKSEPRIGLSVIKFGKSSGETAGKIVDVNADILVDYSFGTFKFVDQILVEAAGNDFAIDGDSGALLIAAPQRVVAPVFAKRPPSYAAPGPAGAVGLVFAPAGRFAVACPISRVLESLELLLNCPLVFAGAGVEQHTSTFAS